MSRQVSEGGQGRGPLSSRPSPLLFTVPITMRELPLGLLGSKSACDSQVQTNWLSSELWFLTCRQSVCICGLDLH